MSFQGLLTTLLLPPVGLMLLALAGALAAWRGRRAGGLVAAAAALTLLLLATPMVAGLLFASLEREVRLDPPAEPPQAIIVLSAEAARTRDGLDVGALSLERLRAGAALARRTGLPLLLSGGRVLPDDAAPLAALMARSLAEDFGLAPRWVETQSRDTRENALFSAALLKEAGIGSAWLVTHGWHMPRALEAFGRAGLRVAPAPVRMGVRQPGMRVGDWIPQVEALQRSWFAIREWTGRLVYAIRD